VIGNVHRALARIAPELAIDVLAADDVQAAIRREVELAPPLRSSPLHPTLVAWLTMAMALFRADSIPNVFARLLARWRASKVWIPLRPVTDGALSHARKRLGSAALRRIFEDVASRVDPGPSFHGLRVWSLDGFFILFPDTPANDRHFGRHPASINRAAFPQFRLLTLSATRTHEIREAHWSTYLQHELVAAPDVVRHLGKGDLLLLDRGFTSVHFLALLHDNGASFVARVRNNLKPRVLRRRGPGDCDVEVKSARPNNPNDRREPRTMVLRLIEYRVGRELVRLLANLSDPAISAREIAELYHERWEIEIGFDEIKNHFAAVRHGTLDLPFRGKSPGMVEQEMWATLTAYNLVRRVIAQAARVRRIDPRRISFTSAVVVIITTWQTGSLCGAGRVRAYVRLAQDLADCVLDRWRRPRRWPRVIRVRSKPFAHKAPWDREQPFDSAARLRMGRARYP